MVFFWKKTKERVMRKRKKLLFAVLTCLMIFACGAITVFAADGGKEYVAKMRKDRLEKWYDELYQMILLAFLLMDNTKRTDRVKELKVKINES